MPVSARPAVSRSLDGQLDRGSLHRRALIRAEAPAGIELRSGDGAASCRLMVSASRTGQPNAGVRHVVDPEREPARPPLPVRGERLLADDECDRSDPALAGEALDAVRPGGGEEDVAVVSGA